MHFFKNFDWSFKSILKVIGVGIVGIAALSVAIVLIGFAVQVIFYRDANDFQDAYFNKMSDGSYAEATASQGLSISRDASSGLPPMPTSESPAGDDAEAYEVKEYTGQINTRHLERDCQLITDLKTRKEVIFETSNQSQDYCDFRFKVKKENADEIVALIENMDPEYFNANIQTIKATLQAYTNDLEILTKNLEETELALKSALEDYDSVSQLATREGDTETLASIVKNKLDLIQTLNQKRLDLQNNIEYQNQQKADQLDRLNYTFFNLNISKDVIFNWKMIQESWKYQVKQLVQDINFLLQGLTVTLISYAVRVLQAVIYFFLALFVIKGVWMGIKKVWKMGVS